MEEEELVKWETLMVHLILSPGGKPEKVPLLGYMGKTLTSISSAQAITLHQTPAKRQTFQY
jgi:hypothetical protein